VRIEQIFREESPRILATLIRLLGSFDLAEVTQEAFTAALEQVNGGSKWGFHCRGFKTGVMSLTIPR
jgi:hypothetical protein